MQTLRRVVAVAFLAGALTVMGLAVPAGAGDGGGIACGTSITQNTTLTQDLGCPSTAIRFGADNITLNLNGFRVFRTGEGNCDCPGIHVLNRQGDSIVNGTVQGFSTGIYLEGGGRHTISGVIARDNVGLLSGNTLFGEGIQLFESNNNRIVNSQMIRNGTFSGINLYDSSGNVVQSNNVAQNNILQVNASHGGPRIMQDIGIWVISLSSAGLSRNNQIIGNSVTQNGLDGIQVSRFSVMNTVTGNTATGNGFGQVPGIRDGDGIAVFGVNNLFQSNSANRNAGNGIGVRAPGTQVGPGNRLFRNNAFGNNAGPNQQANFDLFDASPNCDGNIWSGNQGITFSPPCTRNP
ncbi:MAG: right-handed parallel beta-helix repeat-containing protein [Actinomycetota bacterium]|nr:right-handed parallel beta-helix repeat-containing protein [Actinomycetota bacterium]